MPAIPLRVYAYIALAVAIGLGLFCWWLYDKGHDAGEAKVKAQYAEALAKAEIEAKKQRADDQDKNKKLSVELEGIRKSFAELRANPPKPETLVKIREVKVSEQVSCPVVSLDDSFRLHYNAAASL